MPLDYLYSTHTGAQMASLETTITNDDKIGNPVIKSTVHPTVMSGEDFQT